MRPPTLVFLYGPPAVGKLTVAEALAERAPYRILHNHVVHDAVASVLDRDAPGFWELVGDFRARLVEAAARTRTDVAYTYVYAPGDEPHVRRVTDAWERGGGRVFYVRLVAPRAALQERVTHASRQRYGKPRTAAELERVLAGYDVCGPLPWPTDLTIDTAAVTPDAAADQIFAALAAASL